MSRSPVRLRALQSMAMPYGTRHRTAAMLPIIMSRLAPMGMWQPSVAAAGAAALLQVPIPPLLTSLLLPKAGAALSVSDILRTNFDGAGSNKPITDTDATGHPTIGYGHLCSNSACSGIGYPIPLSEANGKKLLAKDLGVRTLRHF